MSNNKTLLIDPAEYRVFLKQYIKGLYDIDAPMIAGAVERCLQKLDSQPTVDAVEVVRCKDCKNYVWDEFDGCYVCIELSKYVKKDFFCSYGERRTA